MRYAKDALTYGLPAAGLTVSVAWLHAQMLVALPLSILAFLGLYFILNPRGATEEARDALRADVLAKLDECQAILRRVRALLPGVRKQPIREPRTVGTLCNKSTCGYSVCCSTGLYQEPPSHTPYTGLH